MHAHARHDEDTFHGEAPFCRTPDQSAKRSTLSGAIKNPPRGLVTV